MDDSPGCGVACGYIIIVIEGMSGKRVPCLLLTSLMISMRAALSGWQTLGPRLVYRSWIHWFIR